MCSLHSIVPWVGRIVENWWSLEKQFLHIFQRSEGDLEIPHQNWQTDGNPACGWERATSRTSTLSEQTMDATCTTTRTAQLVSESVGGV